MRRPAYALAALGATTTLGLTVAVQAPAAAQAAPSAAAPTAAAPAVPQRYLDQKIDWKPCFPRGVPAAGDAAPGQQLPPGAERLKCGSFAVPRDWARPGERIDLEIAVSMLSPRQGTAEGALLTNPGGPGAAGRLLPTLFLDQAQRVAQRRDVVGIDVRGTGQSTNVTCGAAGAGGAAAPVDQRDASPATVRAVLDGQRDLAAQCRGAAGELGRFVTTEQTVRDFDLLRALLGREKVDFLGYSGGTWLGAAYATLFPQRVGRFVLDSNAEFTAPWQATFDRQTFAAERRFRADFLPFVAEFDRVFGLGRTPKQVRARYEALRATLKEKPVTVTVGEGEQAQQVTVDFGLLDGIVFAALFGKEEFEGAAQLIVLIDAAASGRDGTARAVAAARRNLAPATTAHLVSRARSVAADPTEGAPDAEAATFQHIICNDTAFSGDRTDLERRAAQRARRAPLKGWPSATDTCAFWDRTGVPELPARTGAGVPPVQLVQSVTDSQTSFEGAARARARFAGARMVTVVREGDHGIFPGNPCVDRQVESFLLGDAGARDVVCRGVGLPVPAGAGEPGDAGRSSSPLVRVQKRADAYGPLPR